MTYSDLVFKAYFHNYFMSCYKQKILPHLQELKRFYLPAKRARPDRVGGCYSKQEQIPKYFSFHCLSSFGGGFTVVFTFFLSFKQVYAHADSIYLSAIKLPVITLRIIKYLLQQEEPGKRPPEKK